MGGGPVIRATAKVTGIGLVNSPHLLRGVFPETPLSALAHTVSRPIGTISVKSYSDNVNTSVDIDAQSPERSCSGGIDDWEFADSDEEIISPSNDHYTSPVFGAPPTIEEAKSAIGELKDALERIIVSSPTSNGSLQDYSHSSQLFRIDECENKVCLAGIPSTPTHAIRAFRFLDRSPEVQGVVASIASDHNVWEAVLQNPALQDYMRSQRESFDICYQESPSIHEEMSETMKPDNVKTEFKNELQNIWKKIEHGVIDVMTSLSDFFNSLFGVQGDKEGKSGETTIPAVFGELLGPFMGVTVLVIMVVVLKRD